MRSFRQPATTVGMGDDDDIMMKDISISESPGANPFLKGPLGGSGAGILGGANVLGGSAILGTGNFRSVHSSTSVMGANRSREFDGRLSHKKRSQSGDKLSGRMEQSFNDFNPTNRMSQSVKPTASLGSISGMPAHLLGNGILGKETSVWNKLQYKNSANISGLTNIASGKSMENLQPTSPSTGFRMASNSRAFNRSKESLNKTNQSTVAEMSNMLKKIDNSLVTVRKKDQGRSFSIDDALRDIDKPDKSFHKDNANIKKMNYSFDVNYSDRSALVSPVSPRAKAMFNTSLQRPMGLNNTLKQDSEISSEQIAKMLARKKGPLKFERPPDISQTRNQVGINRSFDVASTRGDVFTVKLPTTANPAVSQDRQGTNVGKFFGNRSFDQHPHYCGNAPENVFSRKDTFQSPKIVNSSFYTFNSPPLDIDTNLATKAFKGHYSKVRDPSFSPSSSPQKTTKQESDTSVESGSSAFKDIQNVPGTAKRPTSFVTALDTSDELARHDAHKGRRTSRAHYIITSLLLPHVEHDDEEDEEDEDNSGSGLKSVKEISV